MPPPPPVQCNPPPRNLPPPCNAPPRGGYNSDDITRVGVVGRCFEPGGSDDGMTITICSFFALQVCVFAELDAVQTQMIRNCKPFWQHVSRNNCTLWTIFMGYIKHCAL